MKTNTTVSAMEVEKRNLIKLCKLTVKSLIDGSSLGSIEEFDAEVTNFCAVLERILEFGITENVMWFGLTEERTGWDFISIVCKQVPNSCNSTIRSLTSAKTPQAKLRAWIRMCLMEKRLAEYVCCAIKDPTYLSRWYTDWSVMRSEEMLEITETLVSLSVIDFSFCLKDASYLNEKPVLDYSPYLAYQQRSDGASYDEGLDGFETVVSDHDVSEQDWHVRHDTLFARFHIIAEQKDYSEQLLRRRDQQVNELKVLSSQLEQQLQSDQQKRDIERQQMEKVIIELQTELSVYQQKVYRLTHKQSVEMQSLSPIRRASQLSPQHIATSDEDSSYIDASGLAVSPTSPSSDGFSTVPLHGSADGDLRLEAVSGSMYLVQKTQRIEDAEVAKENEQLDDEEFEIDSSYMPEETRDDSSDAIRPTEEISDEMLRETEAVLDVMTREIEQIPTKITQKRDEICDGISLETVNTSKEEEQEIQADTLRQVVASVFDKEEEFPESDNEDEGKVGNDKMDSTEQESDGCSTTKDESVELPTSNSDEFVEVAEPRSESSASLVKIESDPNSDASLVHVSDIANSDTTAEELQVEDIDGDDEENSSLVHVSDESPSDVTSDVDHN